MLPASLESVVLNTESTEFVDMTDMLLSMTRGVFREGFWPESIRSKTGLYALQTGGVLVCAKHKKKFNKLSGS
jgi:hypothetical protein